MLNLCRAALAFLRLSGIDVEDGRRKDRRRRCRGIPHEYLHGLRSVVGDLSQPANVVISSAVRKPPRERVDAGSRGLYDIVYAERLCMCTEDLGSESSDGRMEAEETEAPGLRSETLPWRSKEARKEPRPRRPIPPPLPWLANGRTRFLRAVREGGWIRMTEVLIEPPMEVLRATREGGRLRLDLVILSKREEKNSAGGEPVDEVRTGATKIVKEGEEEDQEDDDDFPEEDATMDKTTEEVEAEVRSPTAMVMIRARSGEERRCQDVVSGNGVPAWWNQRTLMIA